MKKKIIFVILIQLNDFTGPNSEKKNKTTELEKSKGNTPRMRSYCRKHGIDDIPDLDIVWKKSHTRGIWKVGEIEVFVIEADD